MSLLAFTCLFPAAKAGVGQIDVTVENNDDGDDSADEQEVIWTGPGWYWGVWMANELEFNYWRRNNYYNHHGDHHNGGHHNGHHGDGGHGGGHHGGGHGGGHHGGHGGGGHGGHH